MKVYISGKIGEEVLSDATREKFARAEDMLRLIGHDVFNPTTSGLGKLAEDLAKKNDTDFYREIMILDLGELALCDAIYLLPDHEDSPGAAVELAYANAVGITPLFGDYIQACNFLAGEFWKRIEHGYTDGIDMKAPWNEALDAHIKKYIDKFWLPL